MSSTLITEEHWQQFADVLRRIQQATGLTLTDPNYLYRQFGVGGKYGVFPEDGFVSGNLFGSPEFVNQLGGYQIVGWVSVFAPKVYPQGVFVQPSLGVQVFDRAAGTAYLLYHLFVDGGQRIELWDGQAIDTNPRYSSHRPDRRIVVPPLEGLQDVVRAFPVLIDFMIKLVSMFDSISRTPIQFKPRDAMLAALEPFRLLSLGSR